MTPPPSTSGNGVGRPAVGRSRGVPFLLAALIARIAGFLSRLHGGGGTSLPGKVLLALCPRALSKMGKRRSRDLCICISATNGKTTSAAMLAALATEAGMSVATNLAGANLRSGIATTLLTSPRSDITILEVDEAALGGVVRDVQPHVIVLGNLFRDQLDRYGELDTLAHAWEDMLRSLDSERTRIVFNADDPLIASLVQGAQEEYASQGMDLHAVSYAIADPAVALPGLPHAADSKFCRACGALLTYDHSYLGHLGTYHCASCGFAHPHADVRASCVVLEGLGSTRITLSRMIGTDLELRLKIPGLYNVYNALVAATTAQVVGIDDGRISGGIASFLPAFGRFERVPTPDGGSLTLLLVKNPTGLNEVIRTLVDARVDLSATMIALNDGIADGRDTSWIWDSDIEPLHAIAPSIAVSGNRADELALRLQYGGWDPERLSVTPSLSSALDEVLERAKIHTEHGHAYALLTYTAMLSVRELLQEFGWVNAFWKGQLQADATTMVRER